jgi:hypothetical protein
MTRKTEKGVGFLLTDDSKEVWVSVGDNRTKVSVTIFLLMASAIKEEWEEQLVEAKIEALKNGEVVKLR